MNDVALVVDQREAMSADFIGSDNVTAFGRTKKGETDHSTEHEEEYAVLAFDAMQARCELRGGD